MIKWLLKTIGVGDELLASLEHASVVVQRPTALWVGLVLLVPIGLFIVRRQRRNLPSIPMGLRIALGTTRIAIVAMLVGVLAGPYLRVDYTVEKKPVVALLFDHSQSMQLPAGPFEEGQEVPIARAAGYPTPDGRVDAEARKALHRVGRAKLAQAAVQAAAATLTEPVAKRFDLRFYGFSREAALLGVDASKPDLPEPPNPGGTSSHLGDAIARVFDDAAGRQVAAIVLFSDGQNTGGRSPAEAARAAADAGTPIFAVPVGPSERFQDVAIVDVFTAGLVAVGDTARVSVTVESQGFDGRPVKVELKDGDTVLKVEDLVLRASEQQKVELSFEAKEPGAKYLTVNIPPLPEEDEPLRANNVDVAFVRVSPEKLKLLLLAGRPQWDFRFVKNALRRDSGVAGRLSPQEPDIVLEDEWRRQPAGAQAAALPGSVEDLAQYHTVILQDVSPALLNPQFVGMLSEAVRDRGLGLVVQAGPRSLPQGFDDRFGELLPVRLRPGATGLEAPVYRPFRLGLSPDGAIHEVMRLYDEPGRNQNAWDQMPPYFWCAATERPAPAAAVLAWNPSVEGRFGKLPLIAYHYAGKGKVLFVGTDSTWLWRQNVGDRFFDKFWGQALRFVARRDEASAKTSWIEVRPIRAQPGERAQVELMAFAADGSPRAERTLTVQVLGGATAVAVEMAADPAMRGRYTGGFPLQDPGDYRVRFEPGAGTPPVEARIRVLVAPEEMRHPNANRPTMALLASTSGGVVVELPALASIPARLKGESKLATVHREASLWDNWLTLAVLMFVYSLDVGLRRLAGLS